MLSRSQIHLGFLALRPLADAGAIAVGFWAGYVLRFGAWADFLADRFGAATEAFEAWRYGIFTAEATLVGLVVALLLGHYGAHRPWTLPRAAGEAAFLAATLIALIIAYFFFSRSFFFSRLVLASAAVTVAGAVWLGRATLILASRWIEAKFAARERVAFIGDGRTARLLTKVLAAEGWAEVVGVIDEEVHPSKSGAGNLPLLGAPSDFTDIATRERLDAVIQVREIFASAAEADELREAVRSANVRHFVVPRILERHGKNFWVEDLGGLPAIELRPSPLDGWGRIAKRALDIFGSATGLLALSPVLAATAIGVKLSSPGPVLYRDFRVGLRGEKFVCLKFRSMRAELCDGELDGTREGNAALEALANSAANLRSGPLHKIQSDPRRTKFGEFIRKTSLDELPQLLNVLRGDMSLVGPRPHMTKEVAKYEPRHRRLFAIKPGLTGAAQVSGRSDLGFEDECRLDLAYIENWSLLRDIEILVRTVLVVLFHRHRE